MENEQIHQLILEIILGKDIALLTTAETERNCVQARFCVPSAWMSFSMDEEGFIYNTEAQKLPGLTYPKKPLLPGSAGFLAAGTRFRTFQFAE